MPIGRITTHRKITPMYGKTFTERQWLDLWQGLGRLVTDYCVTVETRIDGLTTELHESKITEVALKTDKLQIQIDNFTATRKPIRAQSHLTFEVLGSLLDTVLVMREIDRDICGNCDCDECSLTDLTAVACIEFVKILSSATITEQ